MTATSPRPIHFNDAAASWKAPLTPTPGLARRFHTRLPDYRQTPIVSLDAIARELGVRAVYVKDESDRFGLPAFKILGASWAVFRAVTRELGFGLDADIATVRQALISRPIPLFAATEGNHGRAVARMGSLLSTPVQIHVPQGMHPATVQLIRDEKATVEVSAGDYDLAMKDAHAAAVRLKGVLIQDFGFESYEEISQWVVEGYRTMLSEVDDQLDGTFPRLVVAPVGVGSFAQAVVSHFKREEDKTRVLAVEPDTAACLWKSLRNGDPVSEKTTHTIMAGLNCGTLSSIAWPVLKSSIDACVTISDYESHIAARVLHSFGITAGPCGAAPFAALRRLTVDDKARLGLDQSSVVVLLCTEGTRAYSTPLSVSTEMPVALTQSLVQINSANPSLGSVPGPGETAIAGYIRAWLEHRNIETHWIEPTTGRPSIVGIVRGSGGGKSLLFNGHMDTVTTSSYVGDPLGGELRDGKIYGRGSADMKGGLAAALVALSRARKLHLRGDVIFAGVADEEATSIGTEQVLAAGWRADGAIVSEPTDLSIVYTHKGFVWLEVDIHGLAAHGSRADLGIDAIAKAGHFLVELDRYAERLRHTSTDSPAGPPTVHASIIKGGEEPSSYPALCTIIIERRTVAGETTEAVVSESQRILDKLSEDVKDFRATLRVTFSRPPFIIPLDHPFTSLVTSVVEKHLGRKPTLDGWTAWTDCALLADKGIPGVICGPVGVGLHSKEEYVEADSVNMVADALTSVATEFCK